MSGDQWLEYGDCSICRRQKYCKKPCKAAVRRERAEIANTIFEIAAHTFIDSQRKKSKCAPKGGEEACQR